jgi:putative nucleotidyltransferase with HDIG domain
VLGVITGHAAHFSYLIPDRVKTDKNTKAVKSMKRTFNEFFRARVQSVVTDVALVHDVYLLIGDEPVLFRRVGDTITSSRMRDLQGYRLKEFLIPLEQREAYRKSLRDAIRNTDLKREIRGKFIKESAFNHVDDLFTKPDLSPLLNESRELVEEMVNFISADMEAAASLMRLSTHDYYTYNHSVNVAVYSIAISKRVLGDEKSILIAAGLGGLLHDIGKRKVDIAIINKPDRLSPDEWNEVKKHPDYGMDLLKGLNSIPETARRVVHEHHENIDGSGYPQGLNLEGISKHARVAAIADVFDALTTKRPYKEAASAQSALEIMYGMQPGKFDPSLFKNFDTNLEKKNVLQLEKDFDPCSPDPKIKKVG